MLLCYAPPAAVPTHASTKCHETTHPTLQYVPNLAADIVKGNREDPEEQPINLQGFLVGGWVGWVGGLWLSGRVGERVAEWMLGCLAVWLSAGWVAGWLSGTLVDMGEPVAEAPGGVWSRPCRETNLHAVLAGNALTDPATDSEGAVRFWWPHTVHPCPTLLQATP